MPCAPLPEIAAALARHGEAVRARGLAPAASGGLAVVEFYVSADGGWTIVVVRPNGMACIIAGGTDWQEVPQLKGKGA